MADKFECRFCKKKFSKENTLLVHKCMKKQRYEDRDTVGARLGLEAYNLFLKSCSNRKQETQESFIHSKYYKDFVKFGRALCDLNPLSTEDYIKYLVKEGVALSKWCRAETYDKYIINHLETEPVQRGLERSITVMADWAERNNMTYADYFNHVSTFEAVSHIQSGKITPWLMYLSDGGQALMERFSQDQIKIIQGIINPGEWQLIFNQRRSDVNFALEIIDSASL